MTVVFVANGPVSGINLRERSLPKARKFQLVAAGASVVKIRDRIAIRLAGMKNEQIVPLAARQRVSTASPIDRIIAGQATDRIVASRTSENVIARRAENRFTGRWWRRRNVVIDNSADTSTVADGGAVGRI